MSAPRNDNASEQAGEGANKTELNPNNTSAANARAIILRALRKAPETTLSLREKHDVMSPAPRVFELRASGYQIDTIRVRETTADGVTHVDVAKYVLQSEAVA